jgi:hypothetical protein
VARPGSNLLLLKNEELRMNNELGWKLYHLFWRTVFLS